MTIPRSNSTARSIVNINSKLEKQLLSYMAAAGTATLAVLAVAQPAEAKIVYTPLDNVTLINLGNIDLNNDGVVDFTFHLYQSGYGAAEVIYPAVGNAIVFGRANDSSGAFPLAWNTRIGPKALFVKRQGEIAAVAGCHSYCSDFGPWQGKTNHYLGLKFAIAGRMHYGWMRLTVTTGLSGVATGYAYEDIPEKPILAGRTSTPAAETATAPVALPVKQSQSLGMLARGTDAVTIWRRDENEGIL